MQDFVHQPYHILQNSNLHNYYPKPQYLIIGSFGPLGKTLNPKARRPKPAKLGTPSTPSPEP